METYREQDQEKRKLKVKWAIGEFLKRCRQSRELELSFVSKKLNIIPDELLSYESGQESVPNHILYPLVDLYNVHHQLESLLNSLSEFKNPGTQKQKESMAKDLYKRFGIIPSGVDFKNLNTPKGTVLKFPKK